MSDLPPDNREFLSPKKVAARSGLAVVTVRRYVADGRLPSAQPGGRRSRVLIPAGARAQFIKVEVVTGQDSEPLVRPSKPLRKSNPGPAPRWLSPK